MSFYPRPLCLALALASLSLCDVAAEETTQAGGFRKPGYDTDQFRLLPEVEASAYYDDNIYATRRSRESDWVALISPSLGIDSLWRRHSLNLDAGAHLGRYADNAAEDYEDYWLSGEGEAELTPATRLYGSAGYSHNHESRDSKESVGQTADEPTTYDVASLQLGVTQRIGDTSGKLGITHESLDYDNVGALYNDDRDRDVSGLGLRVSHPLSAQTQLYGQAIVNRRDYRDRRDQFGYRKDSQGYSALVGVSRESPQGHRIDAYLGQLHQEYDEARFDEVSEASYGLDLRWYPSQKTQLTGKLDRSLNETTEEGSSGYRYTLLDLRLEQKLATDFLGYLNYNRGLAEFQEVGREDLTHSFSLGLKYYASPWIMITASFSHISNDSNDLNRVNAVSGSYDYERNLIFLTLRARLAP